MGVKTCSRFFAALAICAALPALAAEGASPLSQADLIKQATQQSANANAIARLPDGNTRISSPMQALEAVVGKEGISVRSTAQKEPGNFTLRAVELGRAGGAAVSIGAGTVQVEEGGVQIRHPNLTEELTTSAEGVRQDFVLTSAPSGQGELRLTLAAHGAKVAKRGDAVSLTLSSGRELLYHDLKVTDSAGKVLPSHFATEGERLVIAVEDRGARYPVRIDPTITDADWIGVLERAIDSNIDAMVWTGHTLYIGGRFSAVGGISACRVAAWDGSHWSALGGGIACGSGGVNAMAWDASSQTLYVGGGFTGAEGKSVNRVAKWSNGAWSALDTGVDGPVYALAWDHGNQTLYAAGNFTQAGTAAVDAIALWRNNAWSAVGDSLGTKPSIGALLWDENRQLLYAGGWFTNADGTISNLAQWNGTAWAPVDGGVNGSVTALASDGTNLYVGGGFTQAGATAANYVAMWDGTQWSEPGGGVAAMVTALEWDGTHLNAATESLLDGVSVARLSGGVWSNIGSFDSTVGALASAGTSLYASGNFTSVNGTAAHYIARWSEQKGAWSSMDNKGVDGNIYALQWDGANLYAAGTFRNVGGVNASGVAKWDGSSWSALESGIEEGVVLALAWDGSNLYAGGVFAVAGGFPANSIAKWDGTIWSPLNGGVDGFVYALVCDGTDLYAGGAFTTADGNPANFVAKWSGGVWSDMGGGLDAPVYWLALGGKSLYAAGAFTNSIAEWNGTAWSTPGGGISGDVYALAWDGTNLYAAGQFAMAGTTPAASLARWDGHTWSSLGNINLGKGPGNVQTLASDGKNLYVGGSFDSAGGTKANNIAKWDGTTWSALGSGTDDMVFTLVKAGDNLYASGLFNHAGGKRAALASVDTRGSSNGGSGGGGALGWVFLIGLGLLARRRSA